MGKIANRQSLAFSERNELSQAQSQFYVESYNTDANRKIRIAAQQTQGLQGPILCGRGKIANER